MADRFYTSVYLQVFIAQVQKNPAMHPNTISTINMS